MNSTDGEGTVMDMRPSESIIFAGDPHSPIDEFVDWLGNRRQALCKHDFVSVPTTTDHL